MYAQLVTLRRCCLNSLNGCQTNRHVGINCCKTAKVLRYCFRFLIAKKKNIDIDFCYFFFAIINQKSTAC
jgi:hypothetical protein